MARKTFLTMRDLQKISAKMIDGMQAAMPIKSGNIVVGIITPLRNANLTELAEVEASAAELAAARSEAEEADLERAFQLVESGKAESLLQGIALVKLEKGQPGKSPKRAKGIVQSRAARAAVRTPATPKVVKKRRAG